MGIVGFRLSNSTSNGACHR